MKTRCGLPLRCILTPILLASLASGCDCAGYDARRPGGGTEDPCERWEREGGERPSECDPCGSEGCDCDESPFAAGCPCDAVEPRTCYFGPPEAMGVGECAMGMQFCQSGLWGECDGDVAPGEEVCDELDNDCDGETDEGVLSACGDCSESCTEIGFGHEEGQTPFAPDDSNSSGVESRDPGDLVLGGDEYQLYDIWIPHTTQGLVSKVSTETLEIEGTYRTGPFGGVGGPVGTGDDPSRTSVDYRGNAYIANRYGGSMTKILERDCPGGDTSSGWDDVLDWEDDDCVAWNTPISGGDAIVRVSVVQTRLEGGAPKDYVWAGDYMQHRVFELDADTGEETGTEAVLPEGCYPYGGALDRDGMLWISCSPSVARFDTADTSDVAMYRSPAGFVYGITVDDEGYVWTGGSCQRFDPEDETFTTIPGCTGYGVAADDTSVWVGGCGSGTCRIDRESLEFTSLAVPSNRGVAVDFDGYIWALPTTGQVSIIDPESETSEEVLRDCDGALCIPYIYAYSDLTGLQLRNATTPSGTWQGVVEGCPDGGTTRWVRISWDAETPESTSVLLQVRAGDTLEALAAAEWIPVAVAPDDASPADLEEAIPGDEDPALIELSATLVSGIHGETPVLHSYAVQRSCPDGFR